MELEVGMYVRAEGAIGKICGIEEVRDSLIIYQAEFRQVFDFVSEKTIEKASHNIIKLVEENDFVNGKKITQIIPPDVCGDEELTDTRIFSGDEEISEENIKTIVTHEHFEAMAYRIGE